MVSYTECLHSKSTHTQHVRIQTFGLAVEPFRTFTLFRQYLKFIYLRIFAVLGRHFEMISLSVFGILKEKKRCPLKNLTQILTQFFAKFNM